MPSLFEQGRIKITGENSGVLRMVRQGLFHLGEQLAAFELGYQKQDSPDQTPQETLFIQNSVKEKPVDPKIAELQEVAQQLGIPITYTDSSGKTVQINPLTLPLTISVVDHTKDINMKDVGGTPSEPIADIGEGEQDEGFANFLKQLFPGSKCPLKTLNRKAKHK